MQEKKYGPETATAGVCIERDEPYFVVYRGTREALLAAGLTKPENFPEGKKRLSWHYPRTGENWGIRRKKGNVYCLTKLKDRRGIVDAEVAAFKLAAAAEAKRDAGFQRFLGRMRFGIKRADSGPKAPDAATTQSRHRAIPDFPHGHGNGSARQQQISYLASGHADSLGRLAVATLLAGITLYFWMRKQ